MDKIRIISGLLGDFSTAPWGCLKAVDGKVTLDKVKAFNRARRMLNAGANAFRIFRQNQYEANPRFDFWDDGYLSMLKEFVEILHQPIQGPPGDRVGADVLIDMFDMCSDDKNWIFNRHSWPRAEGIMQGLFDALGGLPYVKFRVGNELNTPDSIPWVTECVYPMFKKNGRLPYSFGAIYSTTDDWLEWQKSAYKTAFGEDAMCHCYRPVHHVKDDRSIDLLDACKNWIDDGNPLSVEIGPDGVMDGLNTCDKTISGSGAIQTRPSREQFASAVKYFLSRPRAFLLPDGHVKYGVEWDNKVVNNDACVASMIQTISDVYLERFGSYPENVGRYPLDWIEYVDRDICSQTGKLHGKCCNIIWKTFIKGQEPQETCMEHDGNCKNWLSNGRLNFRSWYHCVFKHGEKRCP